MPGNPHEMITMAERRFPIRIRIAVPPGGLGQRYARMTAWLDENCGAEGWTITAFRDAWSDQRRRFDLFPRHDTGRRVCSAVVRRVPGGDGGGRVSGAR